jgi:putative ABC transport system ATP-binding protein
MRWQKRSVVLCLGLTVLSLGQMSLATDDQQAQEIVDRVAVARAMVTEPALILADEPTANLDSATAAALLDVMEQLNRATGTTFIFSTHDLQVMERAHRLIRLRDGQIVSDVAHAGHTLSS